MILVFASDWIIVTLNIKNFDNFKFYIPLGVFSIGLYSIFKQWAFRKKSYKSISKTKYFQAISQNVVRIGFGLFRVSYVGLLLGAIVGESAGIMNLSASFLKNDRYLLKHLSYSKIKFGVKRYINFPLFSVLGQIFNASGTHLPPLLMSYLFGNQMVGYYGLAHTVISLPMAVIGNSVGDVFYGEAAGLVKKDVPKLRRLVFKLSKQACLFSLIPLVTLLLGGPFLFSLIFGEAWREAGVYAQIIVIFILFRFISAPIDKIYLIFEKQKMALVINVLRAVSIFIVFFLSKALFLNSYMFLGLYSIAMSLIYILTFFKALGIINNKIKD
jgi:O-antigen/teichoic acid export membrane protein